MEMFYESSFKHESLRRWTRKRRSSAQALSKPETYRS